jgi:hypothetical protein
MTILCFIFHGEKLWHPIRYVVESKASDLLTVFIRADISLWDTIYSQTILLLFQGCYFAYLTSLN